MKLDSGHEVEEITGEEAEVLKENFRAYKGIIRLHPDGWFFLSTFQKYANGIYNFQFRATDVVIMSFPKSGTTWTQEIVWKMRYNPDFEKPSTEVHVLEKIPFIDYDFLLSNSLDTSRILEEKPLILPSNKFIKGKPIPDGIFLQMAEEAEDPRTLKVHMPFSLLPRNMLDICKVIYVVRNPKDVCVSFHHHCRLLKSQNYVGSMEKFVDLFIQGKVVWGPYWPHVKEAWTKRHNPNLHFVFYEDLKTDPKKEISLLDKFLCTNLTDAQINKIIDYTSFAAMKSRNDSSASNPSPSYNSEVLKEEGGFFRKGEVGDFRSKLSKEQEDLLDKWMKDNIKGTDISFKV